MSIATQRFTHEIFVAEAENCGCTSSVVDGKHPDHGLEACFS